MSRLVTVFGGSGFIGRYVVQRLAARGDRVRVAVRSPNAALFLKPLGDVGQVQVMAANLNHEGSVKAAVAGADAVINLVGVLTSSGNQSFDKLQHIGAGRVAAAAAAAGVKTLVHMSAIGADAESRSKYAASKGMGEDAVRDAFAGATILRPSLVIGQEDGFFNRFAAMANQLPVLALPGTETQFQPAFVGDVADAIVRAADGGKGITGQTFELGGPEVMTLQALLERMMDHTTVHRPIVTLPFGMAKFMAFFMGMLPSPPLTMDQVELLKSDNIVTKGAKGFKALGVAPSGIDAVLPAYMVQYRPQGQFT